MLIARGDATVVPVTADFGHVAGDCHGFVSMLVLAVLPAIRASATKFFTE